MLWMANSDDWFDFGRKPKHDISSKNNHIIDGGSDNRLREIANPKDTRTIWRYDVTWGDYFATCVSCICPTMCVCLCT